MGKKLDQSWRAQDIKKFKATYLSLKCDRERQRHWIEAVQWQAWKSALQTGTLAFSLFVSDPGLIWDATLCCAFTATNAALDAQDSLDQSSLYLQLQIQTAMTNTQTWNQDLASDLMPSHQCTDTAQVKCYNIIQEHMRL